MIVDIRYGLRKMAKSPGFAAIAILILAVGIGTTAAVFSFADAILFKPVAFHDPDRLVLIREREDEKHSAQITPSRLRDWREQSRAFTHLAPAPSSRDLNLTGPAGGSEAPEKVRGEAATANYFDLVGVQAAMGRTFVAGEDEPGRDRVVVLANKFWRRRFASDPQMIGSAITLDGEKFTIVGVLPEGSVFDRYSTEIWLPNALGPNSRFWGVCGRLKSGATLLQAQAELQSRVTEKERRVTVERYRDRLVRAETRETMLLLTGAVALILLIACANVASLLLARAAGRTREAAVRSALGATRPRLIRQMLVESVLLAVPAGVLGAILSTWLVRMALLLMPRLAIPDEVDVSVDGRVLLFALGLSALTGVLSGLAPAWSGSRVDLAPMMRARERFRAALVVLEVAVTFVLVVGAGLLVRSFTSLMSVDPGFDPGHVLTLRTDLPRTRYGSATQLLDYQNNLLGRIRSMPAVRSAAATDAMPLGGRYSHWSGHFEGPSRRGLDAVVILVTPGYFESLGIRVMEGRTFSTRDAAGGEPVAVVSRRLATEFGGGESILGKRVSFQGGSMYAIAGVVADVKRMRLEDEERPTVYVPFAQLPAAQLAADFKYGSSTKTFHFVIRAVGRPDAIAGAVQQLAAAVDREQPVYQVATMEKVIGNSVAQPRFRTVLSSVFAVLALVLAAAGIYGVMHYSVAQRTQEIGVRMALGARQGDVVRMVIRQGLGLVLGGIVLGAAASVTLSSDVASYLIGITPSDPAAFGGVAAITIAVSVLACLLPARKAARVDPMTALRRE